MTHTINALPHGKCNLEGFLPLFLTLSQFFIRNEFFLLGSWHDTYRQGLIVFLPRRKFVWHIPSVQILMDFLPCRKLTQRILLMFPSFPLGSVLPLRKYLLGIMPFYVLIGTRVSFYYLVKFTPNILVSGAGFPDADQEDSKCTSDQLGIQGSLF